MKKTKFIIKRLLQVIPMLFIVSVLAFVLNNLSAGDAAVITLRSEGVEVTETNIEAVKKELGLDKPLFGQYAAWLRRVLRFDFGISFQTKKPVAYEIMSRFPATLKLALTAALFSFLIALPAAFLSARYKNKFIDHFFRVFTTAGAAMPDFWIGLIILFFLAVKFNIFPVISGNKMRNIFLPAFTISLAPAAAYTEGKPGNAALGDSGEKEVVIGIYRDAAMDELDAASYNGPHFLYKMIYEALVEDGGKEGIVPQLAEKWKIDDSGREYTFKLREGVKFSDGSDFNADNVVFNMKRWINNERHSSLTSVNVESIEAVDENTVKIVYRDVSYPILTELSYPRPVRFLSSNAVEPAEGNAVGNFKAPVGTGRKSCYRVGLYGGND